MAASVTEALNISADMSDRVRRCATAWLCVYAFLTVGSIMSSL